LKLNRSVSNKNAIRNAFLFSERAQDSAKITYSNFRNESEICDDLKSNAVRENAEDTSEYTRKAAKEKDDSELNKIENRETKKVLE